mgnify:CR=1 FL=1
MLQERILEWMKFYSEIGGVCWRQFLTCNRADAYKKNADLQDSEDQAFEKEIDIKREMFVNRQGLDLFGD